MVTRAFVRPGRATCFVRHAACVDAALAAAALAAHGTAGAVPTDGRVNPLAAERVRAALEALGAKSVMRRVVVPAE